MGRDKEQKMSHREASHAPEPPGTSALAEPQGQAGLLAPVTMGTRAGLGAGQ